MGSFLFELNAKIELNEGIEGHRAILREIYRSGCISLQDLAYKTLLPIPVLSKVVNFLIEKEILSRIPEGILYTEKGMHFIEETLGFYGFGIASCENCDNLPVYLSPRWDSVVGELEPLFEKRPTVDTTLDQAFADPETAILRALYLYSRGALEGKNIALMGDDDYTSVAISYLYQGFYPEEPKLVPSSITIFDIDSRITTGIEQILKPLKFSITTKIWDYRLPLPSEYLHKFDTILVDPPYSFAGIKLVLSRAIGLIREEPGGEVYLSYAHRSAKKTHEMQKLIVEMGFSIHEIHPRFNYYEGGQILGSTTQMMRLITTESMQSVISIEEKFEEPIYTGEVNPTIKLYYCANCDHMVSIGKGMKIKTIENLKEIGCPHCQSKGPFHLDEKIDLE